MQDKDDVEMQLDSLVIPMPDEGFEERLFSMATAQPRVRAANDNGFSGYVKRHKIQMFCGGSLIAAMLALAISLDVSSLSSSDPMIGDMHMLADVDYIEEEQLFAGLEEYIY